MQHQTNISTTRAAILALVLIVAPALAVSAEDAGVIAIKSARVYPVGAAPIDNGIVLIRDGRVAAIGTDVTIPDGAKTIDLHGAIITPGLIDAHAAVDPETPRSVGEPPASFWNALAERSALQSVTELPNTTNLRDAQDSTPFSLRIVEEEAEHDHGDAAHVHNGSGPCCPVCGTRALPPFAVSSASRRVMSEQSAEVIPHRLAIDSYNPLSNDFERLLRSGVTTVYLSPDSAAVIGMRGAIVKTGGPAGRRVVRRADAIKASVGSDPVNRGGGNNLPDPWDVTFRTRRPTTRMGVEWVFRKAMFDARRAAAGLPITGSDPPPADAFPALNEMLDGKIGLRIQARKQHDIFTALRLAAEFGLKFVLEEATEVYQALPQIKSANVSVVFGPVFIEPRGYRAFSREADDSRLSTPRALFDAGIPFALTANDLRDEDGLVRQAMIAVRYGLPEDAALRAITAAPAEIMGLGDGFGTLAVGAPADLVVWSAEPFDAASRPVLVMIDGQVVHEE